MSDDRRFYAIEAPRRPNGRLFQAASAGECVAWARFRSGPGAPQLAVWAAVPPPDEGADLAICLLVPAFEDARAAATDVVDRWEHAWLLIESAPRGRREEAREALIELVALALAAASGRAFDDQMDFVF